MLRFISVAFLLVVLSIASAQSAAPSTHPATAPATRPATALKLGERKIAWEFLQDDKPLVPDDKGVIHLKPAPFAIRFKGDVDNLFMIASANHNLANELAKEKRPVVFMHGTSGAYSKGDFFLHDDARLVSWDAFQKFFGPSEDYTKLFKDKLGQTPAIFNVAVQYPATFAGHKATEHTFVAEKISSFKGTLIDEGNKPKFTEPAFKDIPEISLVMILTDKFDDNDMFSITTTKSITLRLDAK